MHRSIGGLSLIAAGVIILSCVQAGRTQEDDESQAFGSRKNPGTALIGIFYDTKQSQKRAPVNGEYPKTFEEFLESGWDESFLNRFFRGTRPLYATQVFLPNRSANEAPKAFGLEKVVEPKMWFVIYKGQVSPPEDGTYRFNGIADDVLAVAVNGKTELAVWYASIEPWHSKAWTEKEPDNPRTMTVEGRLHHGDWFECKKGEVIDLDVLIGEYPGNLFGAWLFIEKKGAHYETVTDPKYGPQPVLPVFQVAPGKIPTKGHPVPFTTDSPPWTARQ